MKIRTGLTAILWGLLLAAPAPAAFVGTMPSVMELFVTPGKAVTGEISVSNPSGQPMKVMMEVQEGWQERTGKAGVPPAKWLTLSPNKNFTLKPQEIRKVRYKVKLPKGSAGESMAIVFFNVDSAATEGGPLNMQMRHGVSIYAMVRGTSTPEIAIKQLKPSFSDNSGTPSITFALTLENKGNIHIRPRNRVTLALGGNQVASAELDYGYPLYPNNEYKYTGRTSTGTWAPGEYTATVETECGWTYEKGAVISRQFNFTITDNREVQLVQ